jgi:hypothetical protein
VGVVKEIYIRRLLQTENEFETKLLAVVTAYVAGVGLSLTIVVCGELLDEVGGVKVCSYMYT